MGDKVTGIYTIISGIDHLDQRKLSVIEAMRTIAKHNGANDYSYECPYGELFAIDFDGNFIVLSTMMAFDELGSIKLGVNEIIETARRCTHNMRERECDMLPTRNIYIDARGLTQEQRRNAFAAINSLKLSDRSHWMPYYLGDTGSDVDFVLYDIFALDEDGDRVFISNDDADVNVLHLEDPTQLTYEQLMSL